MANFSSFFPVAGGGGGFTKMNKYSTFRALDDATHKRAPHNIAFTANGSISGTSGSVYYLDSSATQGDTDAWVNHTFVNNGTTHTITASTSHGNYGVPFTITFTPSLTAGISNGGTFQVLAPDLIVNPATDLGLENGDSLGYFLVGAGNSNNASTEKGGAGGNILQGTTIISNASTDLVITPGAVTGTNSAGPASTITGGLTLTSADGMPGGWGAFGTSTRAASAWSGVNGYSLGGGQHNEGGAGGVIASNGDGFGWGSYNSGVRAADGAILLFY